jgi:hypothetical protein
LKEAGLDSNSVNWQSLFDKAINRHPPFEPQEEKGFRDALIIECTYQIAAKLPKSADKARVFLVSGDGPIAAACADRTSSGATVSVIKNLDALKSEIKLIDSFATKQFGKDLLPRAAAAFFFTRDGDLAAISEPNVVATIEHKFGSAIRKSRDPDEKPMEVRYTAADTYFVSKHGEQIRFESRVHARIKFVKSVPVAINPTGPTVANIAPYWPTTNIGSTYITTNPGTTYSTANSGTTYTTTNSGTTYTTTGSPTLFTTLFNPLNTVQIYPSNVILNTVPLTISTSHDMKPQAFEFEREEIRSLTVIWEATVVTAGKLKEPKIVDIELDFNNGN